MKTNKKANYENTLITQYVKVCMEALRHPNNCVFGSLRLGTQTRANFIEEMQATVLQAYVSANPKTTCIKVKEYAYRDLVGFRVNGILLPYKTTKRALERALEVSHFESVIK